MIARLPTVFFGHGSPSIALQQNETTRTWKGIADAMPRPRAILCVSAHWLTDGMAITAQPHPPTIHDFGGFPREMHEFQYPAPGDPALADRVRALLSPAPVHSSIEWGFDHGCWTVLMKAFPDAGVPVIQLSLDVRLTPAQHFAIGRSLRPLRDEGVLVMGSGNIVHNLRDLIRRPGVPANDYAARFAARIKRAIVEDPASVADFASWGADAARSVPTPDHFWPLLYVLGAAHPGEAPHFDPDFIEYGSIDMTTVSFGAA